MVIGRKNRGGLKKRHISKANVKHWGSPGVVSSSGGFCSFQLKELVYVLHVLFVIVGVHS